MHTTEPKNLDNPGRFALIAGQAARVARDHTVERWIRYVQATWASPKGCIHNY